MRSRVVQYGDVYGYDPYSDVSLDGTRSKILRNHNFYDRPIVSLYAAGSHMYDCSSCHQDDHVIYRLLMKDEARGSRSAGSTHSSR